MNKKALNRRKLLFIFIYYHLGTETTCRRALALTVSQSRVIAPNVDDESELKSERVREQKLFIAVILFGRDLRQPGHAHKFTQTYL